MSEVPADSGNTESVTGSNEVEEFEKQLILKAHKKHQSTRKAANELGMSQSRFMRKLKKYRDCPS
ncbi:MAG: hypothetical protein LBE31_01040 [Deltaproteobacteria bacterium]|nr:hypothetical protein [Deltaproteobacteria bacterium]